MSNIEHKNIFDLLSVDLDMSPEKLKEMLQQRGTTDFVNFLKSRDMWIHHTDLYLKTEIKDTHGKVLINSGIPINKYLNQLLDKYVKDDRFVTSPFTIDCTENILNLYRSKSVEKMNKILNNYVYNIDSYAALYENYPVIKSEFSDVMSQVLSNTKGICTMLRMNAAFDEKSELIVNSLNSTMISLGLASCANPVQTESSRMLSHKTGIAAMLSKIKDIAGDSFCESTSAEVINTLINDDSIEQAVIMLNNADYDSAPIFTDKVNKMNHYLRILVTVSLFVDLVFQNKTDAHNLEVHKSLYELSDLGYADKETTILLGKMFLPEIKAIMLEQAYNIKNMCSRKPVIWSSVGDMLPVKFICKHEDCGNIGTHKTYIPKDVMIEALGTSSVCIEAGLYFTCTLLTDKLQNYYKTIVRKND